MARKTGVQAWLDEWDASFDRVCKRNGIINEQMTSLELTRLVSGKVEVRILASCCPWDEVMSRSTAKALKRHFESYLCGELMQCCREALVYEFC